MANVQGFHCNTVIVKNETPCIVQFHTYRKNKTLQKDGRKFQILMKSLHTLQNTGVIQTTTTCKVIVKYQLNILNY